MQVYAVIIERLRFYEAAPGGVWPFTLPAVQQIACSSLTFTNPLTLIVGENGVGKSTLVEAIAEAYGLDVRGGHGGRRYAAPDAGRSTLGSKLKLDLTPTGRAAKAKGAQGFFLRAETAMGVFEYMSDHGVAGYGKRNLREVSHGEGYLQVLSGRFKKQGLYLLDEPEAGLSFHSQLALIEVLRQVVASGSQVICATHSPVVAATPGASILEINDHGISPREWAELQLVQDWRRFLAVPRKYLDN